MKTFGGHFALLPLSLAALLSAAGCGSFPASEQPVAAAKPVPAAAVRPAPVEVAPAASHEILSVLSVEHEVELLAQREGTATEILTEEGATIEKGALLARLDDRDPRAKLDRARAELQVAESNVKYNEAEVKARESHYRRAQEMNKAGLNSQADLEEAEFRAKGAAFDLEGWRAAVERQQAEIRALEIDLEKTRLIAPFRGVLTRRYLKQGQTVVKGEKCFRLSQLGPLQVRFLVAEGDPRKPQLGGRVQGELLNDSQLGFEAHILRVSPTVDVASGSYEVTAQLVGAGLDKFRPGMAVKILWGGPSAAARP